MKNKLKRCLCIIAVMFIPIQIYLNNKLNRKLNEKPVRATVFEGTRKDLYELNKELNVLNNCTILNIYNDNDKWCAKLEFRGDKSQIIEEMNKIETYEIKDYIIGKDNTKYYVIMDICSNYLIK